MTLELCDCFFIALIFSFLFLLRLEIKSSRKKKSRSEFFYLETFFLQPKIFFRLALRIKPATFEKQKTLFHLTPLFFDGSPLSNSLALSYSLALSHSLSLSLFLALSRSYRRERKDLQVKTKNRFFIQTKGKRKKEGKRSIHQLQPLIHQGFASSAFSDLIWLDCLRYLDAQHYLDGNVRSECLLPPLKDFLQSWRRVDELFVESRCAVTAAQPWCCRLLTFQASASALRVYSFD